MVSNLRKIFWYCLALQTYSAYLQSMKKACENFGCRYLRFVELSFIIHVVLFFCIQYTNNIVWPFVTLLLQHMYTFHTALIWIWMANDQALLLMVILVHTWLVKHDTTISCHFLWAEMEIILFIHFYPPK